MRDRRKQLDWIKENYTNITGVRVKEKIWALNEFMQLKKLTPEMFFSHASSKNPFVEYGTGLKFHIPRSLIKRARITIDKKSGEVKGRSAMQSSNK